MKRGFGSDNHSGVHPEIMDALAGINKEHVIAYGNDEYTESAVRKFKEYFGEEINVYFVFTGTAANILGLSNLIEPYNAVICTDIAHLNIHECGGIERFNHNKLLTVPSNDGKLSVERIQHFVDYIDNEHMVQPRAVSIAQATEFGTVYTVDEIKEISDFTKKHDMFLHMDGARISNAAVYLDMEFMEFTRDAGIDILSFGGTKNGIMYGEAVVFFDKNLSENFKFIRKQGMQLASKMRFIAAQFETFLSNDLWRRNAKHSNSMAQYLKEQLSGIPEVKITQKVESNAVFAVLPKEYVYEVQKKYFFHFWDEQNCEIRLMASFDTINEDVDGFVRYLKELIK